MIVDVVSWLTVVIIIYELLERYTEAKRRATRDKTINIIIISEAIRKELYEIVIEQLISLLTRRRSC